MTQTHLRHLVDQRLEPFLGLVDGLFRSIVDAKVAAEERAIGHRVGNPALTDRHDVLADFHVAGHANLAA